MPEAITHGQFMRFIKRNHFVPKGKKQNRYVGILDGIPRIITFHYHKDNDHIAIGTLSAIARQLGLTKQELIDKIKTS